MEQQILEKLDQFLKQLFIGVPLYKWALALSVFFLFLLFRKLFSLFVIKSLKILVSRTKTRFDDKFLKLIESPIRFLFIVFGFWFAIDILGVENDLTKHFVRSLFIVSIFWFFYNAIYVFSEEINRFSQKFGQDLSKEIASFITKTLKAFVVILALVAILQEWGINVSALIASMGLGGLALALAAKDTAANLFGGLSILADKIFKIGDWVKVTNDIEGIVEDIGLRTTKIRTFEKSVLTVPNQLIANSAVENFSRRDVRRIKMVVGVVYDTPKETLEKIVKEIRQMLQNHPRIAKNQTLLVYFDEFGDSSLNIFIYCFSNTANWEEWLAIKEDVMLKIMEIVEKNGSSFAFPSRSLYIEKLPEELKINKKE
ncbi:MAG: mechanosensitive ion channel family protein [Aquificae bacterium]|nr:mechanosensitive ion channel family protein [Aquificota bacterium]